MLLGFYLIALDTRPDLSDALSAADHGANDAVLVAEVRLPSGEAR